MSLLQLALGAPLAAMLVVACGSSTSIGTTGTTSGAGGSGGQTSGEGGCLEPTEGQPCSGSDIACQPDNPCCAGYEWTCTAGAWMKAGLGCVCQMPQPFACGSTTCNPGEFCEDQPPGVPPPDGGVSSDYFVCKSVPTSCGGTATCACVGASIPQGDPCSTTNVGVTCDDDGAGAVTLHCLGI